MANSADSDQLASSEANWSGSTLFPKTGYVRVQQDKVQDMVNVLKFSNTKMYDKMTYPNSADPDCLPFH